MNGTMKDSFLDGASGNQVKKMPTASKDLLDIVVQFIGETGTYIQNFFYKCIGTAIESVISAEIGESAGITGATVVKATFEAMRDATGQYIFEFKESLISAVIGGSTGITSASVVKVTFEELITVSGAYNFTFIDSLISASIGSSTGITSATAVKSTFETQIDETSENSFVYNESTANASIGASVGITEATVDKSIFETLISVSGDTVFTFDGTDWKIGETVVDLEDYGIVVTGTAQANDAITITYAAAKWTLSDVEVDLEDYGITFEGTPNDGDTINISYTQSKWELESNVIDLADYGITYVGTPEDGDTITINYTADNWYFENEVIDIADYGLSVTGTPAYDDTIIVDYTAAYTAYSWLNIKVQESNDNLVTKGVWTATGQTDFSTIPLPVSKGWAFFVNGSATINSVDYSSGDLIVFTKDIAEGGTITDDDFDLNDINIVTKDNTITITNKTIDADNNTISNLELDNFKTGVVKTTVSPAGEATNLKLPTEAAVREELDKKQDVLGTATKTVEGKARFSTDDEVMEGASENTMVSAKNLKERGAEFEQLDFALQADILSSTTNRVASNSKFFFFGNGDVSTDGKTIIKQTADFKADNSLDCNENYVVCNSANYSYSDILIWKIGSDGTLTCIRRFTIPNSYGKTQIINGRLFVTSGIGGGGQGIYYLDEIDFETETAMSFVSGAEVKQVAYDTETEQYIIFRPDGVQISDDILDIYTQTLLTFPGDGGISGGKMLEGKLTVYKGNAETPVYYIHQTVIGSGIINTFTLPITLRYQDIIDLQKVANQYVLIVHNGSNGINYYYLAPSLSSFNADNDGVGYALANIGTNYVMVTNTNDILLSEEVKIPILKSEITDLSTADITIANVVANTVYKYGEIDSLAITAVEVSNRKSIIYFSTSADFTTFTPPTAQAFIGSGAVVAEKSYKIEIENGIMEVKEYSVPS